MTAFAIITGVITLLGFIFQIKGLYPEYRRYYVSATFLLFGITIGTAIGALTQTTFTLSETLSTKSIVGFILIIGSGLLIFVCFSATALVVDEKRRSELAKIGSGVSGFLIFLLVFFVPSFFPDKPQEVVTYDEQLQLIHYSSQNKSYERALKLLEDLQRGLDDDDPRAGSLDSLRSQIQQKQTETATMVSPTPTTLNGGQGTSE